MLDVGRRGPGPVLPEEDFPSLKAALDDPAAYLLGRDYEALILPDFEREYYGFPPSKSHVFAPNPEWRMHATGMSPLVTFAAGGLAEAWTGGSYPFNDDDLERFPFGYDHLAPHYETVARRIGITGVSDDLSRFMPLHGGLTGPLELDDHPARLLHSYQRKRQSLNSRYGLFMGRARSAVLSGNLGARKPCSKLGRCLWGCPTQSLYTPSVTLGDCMMKPNFRYTPGHYITHFRFDSGNRVTGVVSRSAADASEHEFPVGRLVLGGGTLSSSAIFMNSIHRDSGRTITLHGLMDNRQVLMPFVNLGMLGRRFEPRGYQYHQLAMGLVGASPRDYVHALITTLTTALIHPLIQQLPFHLRGSAAAFRDLHAALGLINVNFADSRREENQLTLDTSTPGAPRLLIRYAPRTDEPGRIAAATRALRSALLRMGCIAPSRMTRLRPMGASVHYAGTIPMRSKPEPLTCSPRCRSHDFENLYFIDGTSLPDLPAKNLTLTLMANAVRVAELEF